MLTRDRIIVAASLLLLSAPATLAQTAEAPGTTKPAVAPAATAKAGSQAVGLDKGDRIVCRSVRYTGSRFPERTCKTVREMELAREASQKNADTIKGRTQNTIGRGRAF